MGTPFFLKRFECWEGKKREEILHFVLNDRMEGLGKGE